MLPWLDTNRLETVTFLIFTNFLSFSLLFLSFYLPPYVLLFLSLPFFLVSFLPSFSKFPSFLFIVFHLSSSFLSSDFSSSLSCFSSPSAFSSHSISPLIRLRLSFCPSSFISLLLFFLSFFLTHFPFLFGFIFAVYCYLQYIPEFSSSSAFLFSLFFSYLTPLSV